MKKMCYAILIAFVVLATVSSCKKDKKTTTTTPPAGALVLWDNVHIVDSTQWILDKGGVPTGIYRYTFTPSTPNINVRIGDIILGNANGGYIRKVTSISIAGAYYELSTGQAYLSDVFKSGSFNLQIPLNDPSQANPGFARTFTNYRLYHNSNFSLTLANAQFNIVPTCDFAFSFDSAAGLTNFQLSTTNATATNNITLNVSGIMPYLWNSDTILASFTSSSIQTVQAWTTSGYVTVPVVIKLGGSYTAHTNVNSPHNDSINTILNWTQNNVFTGGLQYQGGQWQALHSTAITNVATFDTLRNTNNSHGALTFQAQINSWIYGVSGPQITTGLGGSFLQLQQNTGPFENRTDLWSTASDVQTSLPIIGHNVPSFSQVWVSDSVFYQSPYVFTKISGDGQTALVVHTLPQPLVVKITDSNGQPVSNVYVTFTVGSGGSLSAYSLTTDQAGLAQVTWTLGPPQTTQTVTVTALDGFGHPLNGAPTTFTATGQ